MGRLAIISVVIMVSSAVARADVDYEGISRAYCEVQATALRDCAEGETLLAAAIDACEKANVALGTDPATKDARARIGALRTELATKRRYLGNARECEPGPIGPCNRRDFWFSRAMEALATCNLCQPGYNRDVGCRSQASCEDSAQVLVDYIDDARTHPIDSIRELVRRAMAEVQSALERAQKPTVIPSPRSAVTPPTEPTPAAPNRYVVPPEHRVIFDACLAGKRDACTKARKLPNPDNSTAMMEAGCNAGLLVSCLGMATHTGFRDRGKAKAMRKKLLPKVKRACGAGDLELCEELGHLFADPELGPVDPVRVRALFKKACDGGLGTGCYFLGGTYHGVNPRFSATYDHPLAVAAYSQACSLGHQGACSAAMDARSWPPSPPENGAACAKGDIRACRAWSLQVSEGKNGAARDPAKAAGIDNRTRDLARKACTPKAPEVCEILGVLTAPDAEGLNAYLLACDANRATACVALATIYRSRGKPETVRARSLYQKACTAGNADGCRGAKELEPPPPPPPPPKPRWARLDKKPTPAKPLDGDEARKIYLGDLGSRCRSYPHDVEVCLAVAERVRGAAPREMNLSALGDQVCRDGTPEQCQLVNAYREEQACTRGTADDCRVLTLYLERKRAEEARGR